MKKLALIALILSLTQQVIAQETLVARADKLFAARNGIESLKEPAVVTRMIGDERCV